MNDQRCPVKEKAGHLVRVRVEFATGKETIKNQPSIRQATWLNSQRRDGTSICGARLPEPRHRRVVVRAIGSAIDIIISHERKRRVRQ